MWVCSGVSRISVSKTLPQCLHWSLTFSSFSPMLVQMTSFLERTVLHLEQECGSSYASIAMYESSSSYASFHST